MQKMLIGEVASRANVTPRTVRYYQNLGLLGSVIQEENGYHYYDEQTMERLEKIAVLKQLGLKLDEIKSVIDLYFVDRLQGKQKTLEILQGHFAETQQKIKALEAFKDDLRNNIEKMKNLIVEME